LADGHFSEPGGGGMDTDRRPAVGDRRGERGNSMQRCYTRSQKVAVDPRLWRLVTRVTIIATVSSDDPNSQQTAAAVRMDRCQVAIGVANVANGRHDVCTPFPRTRRRTVLGTLQTETKRNPPKRVESYNAFWLRRVW
jgi:hypothetical protein